MVCKQWQEIIMQPINNIIVFTIAQPEIYDVCCATMSINLHFRFKCSQIVISSPIQAINILIVYTILTYISKSTMTIAPQNITAKMNRRCRNRFILTEIDIISRTTTNIYNSDRISILYYISLCKIIIWCLRLSIANNIK